MGTQYLRFSIWGIPENPRMGNNQETEASRLYR